MVEKKFFLSQSPMYTMNCFKLPKSICEEIERIMANYWWNTQDQGNKTHWVAWNQMKHMKKEGGLGFRDIEKFTDALLSKQAWRILQNPNSLVARIVRGRYFSLSYILRASRGTQPSFGWQSILHGKDLLKTGLRFTVGSGDLIQTWIDPWLSTHPPRAPRPLTRHQATFLVKDLILPNKVGWNERPIRSPGRCSSHPKHKNQPSST